eukprot:5811719-Prymnesium_polylepis.1
MPQYGKRRRVRCTTECPLVASSASLSGSRAVEEKIIQRYPRRERATTSKRGIEASAKNEEPLDPGDDWLSPLRRGCGGRGGEGCCRGGGGATASIAELEFASAGALASAVGTAAACTST